MRGFERDIKAYPNGKCSLAEWTRSVNRTLRLEGGRLPHSYEVYCSDRTPQSGEYLLDHVWFNQATFRADLVVECEWGERGEIAFDFEKLLWVKSPLKVLICDPQRKTSDPLTAILEKLRRYPDHTKGKTYLVIIVGGHPRGGETRAYSWEVPVSGIQPDADFVELSGSPFAYELKD